MPNPNGVLTDEQKKRFNEEGEECIVISSSHQSGKQVAQEKRISILFVSCDAS